MWWLGGSISRFQSIRNIKLSIQESETLTLLGLTMRRHMVVGKDTHHLISYLHRKWQGGGIPEQTVVQICWHVDFPGSRTMSYTFIVYGTPSLWYSIADAWTDREHQIAAYFLLQKHPPRKTPASCSSSFLHVITVLNTEDTAMIPTPVAYHVLSTTDIHTSNRSKCSRRQKYIRARWRGQCTSGVRRRKRQCKNPVKPFQLNGQYQYQEKETKSVSLGDPPPTYSSATWHLQSSAHWLCSHVEIREPGPSRDQGTAHHTTHRAFPS